MKMEIIHQGRDEKGFSVGKQYLSSGLKNYPGKEDIEDIISQ